MSDLESLPNIGKVMADKLRGAGIGTAKDLQRMGATEAFSRIRDTIDKDACLSALCAIEGAIQGVRWHSLPERDKQRLKAFLDSP
jgi:DNA transformation protein